MLCLLDKRETGPHKMYTCSKYYDIMFGAFLADCLFSRLRSNTATWDCIALYLFLLFKHPN